MSRRALPLLLLLAGCVIGGDKYPRPRDLPPSWLVGRTRVLAVRAEPPEVTPGTPVRFEALIAGPPEDPPDLSALWLACPEDQGAGFGCLGSLDGLDLSSTEPPDPETLAELGVIGFEPGLPPLYVPPADLLDGLDDFEAREGVNVVVTVMGLPNALLEDPVAEIDFSTVEAAYKRLVVSRASTPNHNPPIGAFTVDGAAIPSGALARVEPGQAYDLGVLLPDGTRELYEYLNSDGALEERVEEPYSSWYATGGELLETVTLWPYMEATWIAPDEEGATGQWFVVLRDRRGGMSWWVQDWVAARP